MKRIAVLIVLGALSGCTFNAPSHTAPAVYDLGEWPAPTRVAHRFTTTLLIPPVDSPPWLETSAIAYRLAYDNPKRLLAYRESRWAAPPAMLLTEALRSRLALTSRVVTGVDGAQAQNALRVELEDYAQTFDTPRSSRVRVQARATLVDTANRRIVAQRTFELMQDAAPDAAGAASALAAVAHQLIENLLDWVAQNLKNMPVESTADRSVR